MKGREQKYDFGTLLPICTAIMWTPCCEHGDSKLNAQHRGQDEK